MIQKYLYGVPFDTESVVAPIPASQGDPPVGMVKTSESGFCFACPLAEGDRVYGLGEANRGINKRGFVYVSVFRSHMRSQKNISFRQQIFLHRELHQARGAKSLLEVCRRRQIS